MELFIIHQNIFTKEVKVEPVKITKETEKTFEVVHSNTKMRILKSDLPHDYKYGHKLVTSDVKGGIAYWNDKVEKQIEDCRKTLENLESMRITE